MEFPDFRDFLATLDDATISAIMRDANNGAKLVSPEFLIDPQSAPGIQVLAISYQVSLEVLAAYHKWLEQQL